MAVQGPFDWQGRLESEAAVVFGTSWVPGPLGGRGQLTVTHDGVRLGAGPVLGFDRIVAVGTAGHRLTVFYAPLPEDRLSSFERRTGQKRLLLALSRFGQVRADDLAVWLLRLTGGPVAEIDSRPGGGGVARVYRIRT
jgi:hypothetical protein